MDYTVNWSSSPDPGHPPSKDPITVAQQTADTASTSITLTGKGLNNYGLYQQQNFIQLMENFARDIPPLYPTIGQNWYKLDERIMYVWNGTYWEQSSPAVIVVGGLADYGMTPDAGPPVTPFEAVTGAGGDWELSPPSGTLINLGGYPDMVKVSAQTYGEIYFYSQDLRDAVNANPSAFTFHITLAGYGTEIVSGNDAIIGVDHIQFYIPAWYGPKGNATIELYQESGTLTGMATRLNRIIGPPIYSGADTTQAFGWGQTDLVPTYDSAGVLSNASDEAGLPYSQSFPAQFSNASWSILVSRLRKALREVGIDESNTSPVGFISDGRPLIPGNTLANVYNNLDMGPSPNQGTVANITSGFGPLGIGSVMTYLNATKLALDALEAARFDLAVASTQVSSLATSTRTTPGQSLGVPSTLGTYVHTVELTFLNKAKAQAFFNAGGKLEFNWSFTPSGSPSDVELDWQNFLAAFTGLKYDYFGTKLGADYEPYIPAGGSTRGFYFSINDAPDQRVFERDVLDTPGGGLYASDPPTHGGVIVKVDPVEGANYVLNVSIEFYLQDITGEPIDTSLDGTLSSNITAYLANSLNSNFPGIALPSVAQSGTFVTAP